MFEFSENPLLLIDAASASGVQILLAVIADLKAKGGSSKAFSSVLGLYTLTSVTLGKHAVR